MPDAPFAFDAATTIAPNGPDSWMIDLHPTWAIGGRPHGGYLVSSMARAADLARRAADRVNDHPHPVATSAQYLRSPVVGPAEIRTELLRVGRSITQLRATMHQGDHDLVHALFTFGPLHEDVAPLQYDDPPPHVLPIEDCPPNEPEVPGVPFLINIAEEVGLHLDRTDLPVPGQPIPDIGPERPAIIKGHLTFRDGRPQDAFSLLFAVDASPPASMALGIQGWVPTLELTVYVRALPAPGPVVFRQRARPMRDGLIDELCDIWDSTGQLVAQGSQLAAYRLA